MTVTETPVLTALQRAELIPLLALAVIAVGIVILVTGLVMIASKRTHDSEATHESKGIILIGPLPIVWGFGGKVQRIAIVIAFLAFALFLMLALM